jgi:hypothetical protein
MTVAQIQISADTAATPRHVYSSLVSVTRPGQCAGSHPLSFSSGIWHNNVTPSLHPRRWLPTYQTVDGLQSFDGRSSNAPVAITYADKNDSEVQLCRCCKPHNAWATAPKIEVCTYYLESRLTAVWDGRSDQTQPVSLTHIQRYLI